MKKILKGIGLILLLALIAIQFFHPKKNLTPGNQPNALANVHTIPDDVNVILKKACNDCHSNNTVYPWYTKLQPVHWWIDNHIREGKGQFNFDEYSNKRLRYQYHKLEEVIEEVKSGAMPLDSYTWIHKDAKLTPEEKNKLIGWAEGAIKNMEAQYPVDSLKRPKQTQ